jgi:threonine synthase
MIYQSTRGQTAPHSFSEAVEAGLAADGGLFIPQQLPDLSAKLAAWAGLNYAELAAAFFAEFAPEIPHAEWLEMTTKAYGSFTDAQVAPCVLLDAKTSVLELFHGPTLAFKDFALQLLGLLYKRQVAISGKKLAVLGATSGDTGSAAIHGCLGQDGITIFILYPDGKVAPLQERQMACTGAANVYAMPVPGTFDDAQAVVKEAFADTDFVKTVNLSAVNSINIARVLAQCVYYVWAGFRVQNAGLPLEFVVPTGNFGNVLAGWLAKQMNLLPADTLFRVATNQNDILHRFFSADDYSPAPVSPSHAPSMDIQAASNFERYLYYVLGKDEAKLRSVMADVKHGKAISLTASHPEFRSSRMSDSEIGSTIAAIWEKYGYVADPHTACGFIDMAPERHSIVLATASPAKFPEVVAAATGSEPTHPSLERLKSLELKRNPMTCEVEVVKQFVRQTLR